MLSFWESYRCTWVFLRDACELGLEPLSEEHIVFVETSIAQQRVWLGHFVPHDAYLLDQFYMWSHIYFFHYPWYVRKYRGVGSLANTGMELDTKRSTRMWLFGALLARVRLRRKLGNASCCGTTLT